MDILVVEDDLASLRVTVALLEKFGATIQTASDGYDALEKLALNRYHLVVTDIGMPGMNGF